MDIRFKFLDNCSLIINIWNCDILEKYEKSAYRKNFQYRRKICLKLSLEILNGNIVHKFPKFDQLVPMYFMKKQANKGTTTTWLAKSPPHHHLVLTV